MVEPSRNYATVVGNTSLGRKYSERMCSKGYSLICTNCFNQAISQCFFEELKGLTSLSKAILKHYLLVTDDFNVGMKSKSLGYDKLGEFCDLFNLTN